MKIFFHAPITEAMHKTHKLYYDFIKKIGHEHTTNFAVSLDPNELEAAETRKNAKDLLRNQEINIKKADIVILGATEQSIGTGIYMNMAMNLSKPIIGLTKDKKTMPFIYAALNYNKLLVYECTEENYSKIIPKAINEAKKIVDKRFTLLLPPEVVEMLEIHHLKSGETRSEYIRDLIRDDFQKKYPNQVVKV